MPRRFAPARIAARGASATARDAGTEAGAAERRTTAATTAAPAKANCAELVTTVRDLTELYRATLRSRARERGA